MGNATQCVGAISDSKVCFASESRHLVASGRLTHLANWKMPSQFVDPMNFGWIFHVTMVFCKGFPVWVVIQSYQGKIWGSRGSRGSRVPVVSVL
jgi:hypothetical protein